jgi:hypothetical protein
MNEPAKNVDLAAQEPIAMNESANHKNHAAPESAAMNESAKLENHVVAEPVAVPSINLGDNRNIERLITVEVQNRQTKEEISDLKSKFEKIDDSLGDLESVNKALDIKINTLEDKAWLRFDHINEIIQKSEDKIFAEIKNFMEKIDLKFQIFDDRFKASDDRFKAFDDRFKAFEEKIDLKLQNFDNVQEQMRGYVKSTRTAIILIAVAVVAGIILHFIFK